MKALIFIFCLSAIQFSMAQEWQNLFNGKDLSGWIEKTQEGSFSVEEGVIIGTMIPDKKTTFLCYDREYKDFELEFEVKIIDSELNSGVQIRAQCEEPKRGQKYGKVYGPQVELSTKKDLNRSGFIYGQGWKGWITPMDNEQNAYLKKAKWNKVRVLAEGKSIKTWINDHFVYETIIPDERHATNSKGFIALQCHSIKVDKTCKIAWKNIRIKEISAGEE